MPKYLTVNQYKNIADGIPLTGITDMKLAFTIGRAEADVDTHMGFDPKHGGFEPHFLMVQRQFNEHTLKTGFPEYPIPIRQITRYRIQVSNLSTTGAGFFANINSSDCVINNDGMYVEIVPLQAVTYSLSPILLQLGLRPPIVEMDCEVGYYIGTTGEMLIDSGDHTTYYGLHGFWANTYTQALATQPNILPAIPPVIYANGTLLSSSLYTVNYTEGKIVFGSARSASDVITADYCKTIPENVVEATILQTSHLLAQENLNTLGLYRGLWQMRNGEQFISFPRNQTTADQGRALPSPLCPEAAACLTRYESWAIA